MLNIEYVLVSEDGKKSETHNIDIDDKIIKASSHGQCYISISKLMDPAYRESSTKLPEVTGLNQIMVVGYRRDPSESYTPYRAALYGPKRQEVLRARAAEEQRVKEERERKEQARLATQVTPGAPRQPGTGTTEGVFVNAPPRNVPTDQVSGVSISNKSR